MDQASRIDPVKHNIPPIPGLTEAEQTKAAVLIQKTYRGHRARRQLDGFGLDASTRWYEAVRDARYRKLTAPRPPPSPETSNASTGAELKWQKAAGVARRAGADDHSPSVSDLSSDEFSETGSRSRGSAPQGEIELRKQAEAAELRKKTARMMDLQYFLEMVDHKHRYGSSLRKYHNYWKTQDTNQNFFYWLDHGDGRDVDLKECSRARLDKEQVRYLSREERLNYLVKVNEQGLLIWAKNGDLVWTKDELFRDSLKGIVQISDSTPTYTYNVPPRPGHELDSSSADGFFERDQDSNVEGDDEGEEDDSNTEGNEGERYVNEEEHVSAAVLFNHMIRSSMKKGRKWIFVADAAFRLYIGYKQSGAFQHSSFLHGARILAAGLIKVKKGKLGRLSPLSGHYRPPTANFRAFVQSLRDAGVDMSHVSISRSYAVLVGMESYGKTRKKIASVETRVMHGKDKLLNPEKVKAEEQAKQDKSESAKKERLYLERQREAEAGQHQGKKDGHSMGTRLAHTLDELKLQTVGANDSTVKKEEEPKRMPGTGPEDGVPAPEGRR